MLVREVEVHPSTIPAAYDGGVDDGLLARYADAIVRDGLQIGAGDVLAVHAEPIQRELAVALTEAGYRAGARYVDVLVDDPRITRARALLAPEDTLDWRPAWQDARMRELLRVGAGIVWISGSEDPQVLADVPPARAVRRVVDRPGLPPYRRAVGRADARFAVVAWPTPAWAAQVYPDLTTDAGLATLGNDLLRFARLGADDPPNGWRLHAERLSERARKLTELGLRDLRLRAPGTDLQLALPEGTIWRGGVNRVRGHRITPNIPTEEVFTSPAPQATSGTFRCTRPLAIAGRVIEGIAGEFRRGRLVRIEAGGDDDREFLAAYLARDRGAGRLGELALVDSSSRVGAAGRTYFTTLLDENAAAHIAFGLGFGDTRGPGGPAVNTSVIHIDVMIGAPDMDVDAVDGAGRKLPIISGGSFAGNL
ncbi:MAG: aminopeptidase [Gaiellales bacterium]|nr:aminopeptidase [Gaiellales bacterium]